MIYLTPIKFRPPARGAKIKGSELGTLIRGGAKIKGSELGTENKRERIGNRNLKNLKNCAELIPQKLVTLRYPF